MRGKRIPSKKKLTELYGGEKYRENCAEVYLDPEVAVDEQKKRFTKFKEDGETLLQVKGGLHEGQDLRQQI